MIYFNKLIDICINRYESQKVVYNYANGTKGTSFILVFLLSKKRYHFFDISFSISYFYFVLIYDKILPLNSGSSPNNCTKISFRRISSKRS